MHKREDFVGVVLSFQNVEPLGSENDDKQVPTEFLLKSFVGEGNEVVVFSTASVETGEDLGMVIKLPKPLAWLEMRVLAYHLRIHERLFPNHPLLMPPNDRLAALTEEMIERIDSPRLVFRVSAYNRMLQEILDVIASYYSDAFAAAALPRDFYDERPLVTQFIDENLAGIIRELIDDDGVVEEYLPFFEFLRDDIPRWIAERRSEGSFRPMSRNPLCGLFGLKLESFISRDELRHIAKQPSFSSRRYPGDVAGLLRLAEVFGKRAEALRNRTGKPDETAQWQAIAACEVVEEIALWEGLPVGEAMYIRGSVMGLQEANRDAAKPVLESAAKHLRASESWLMCRNALAKLAEFVADDEKRLSELVKEIDGIENALQLAPDQRLLERL